MIKMTLSTGNAVHADFQPPPLLGVSKGEYFIKVVDVYVNLIKAPWARWSCALARLHTCPPGFRPLPPKCKPHNEQRDGDTPNYITRGSGPQGPPRRLIGDDGGFYRTFCRHVGRALWRSFRCPPTRWASPRQPRVAT